MSESDVEIFEGPSKERENYRVAIERPYEDGRELRGNIVLTTAEDDIGVSEEDVKLAKRNFDSLISEAEEVLEQELDTEQIRKDLHSLKGEAKAEAESETESRIERETPADRHDEETVEEAEDLLEEENLLAVVKTLLDHKIAGEHLLKLGLFLQLLSKDTEKPLMIFGVQKHAEGKSHIVESVLELFPEHQVKRLSEITKAALYRRAQKNPNFFGGKIVFVREMPEDEDERQVFQVFRQLVSEGEVSKELVLDKGNSRESVELRLEGAPCVVTTTVNEGIIDQQDMSRGVVFSPEMSQGQNEAVRNFQNSEHELPDQVTNPTEIQTLTEHLRAALDLISEQDIQIVNPFTRDIDSVVPEDTDNIKRDYPKILRIASQMPARLYNRQRPKVELSGGEVTLVTWKDVVRGTIIMRGFINDMIKGRSQAALDVFPEIKDRVEAVDRDYDEMEELVKQPEIDDEDSFTNQDLEKWTGVAAQTAREYTRRLDRMEIIYKDSSVRPNKHYRLKDSPTEDAVFTLRTLHTILASVIEQENLSDWARRFCSRTAYDGGEGELCSKVGLSKNELPLEFDVGTTLDPSLPTPVYMQNAEQKFEGVDSVKIDESGGLQFCGPGSVIESFSDTREREDSQSEVEERFEDMVLSELRRQASESSEDKVSYAALAQKLGETKGDRLKLAVDNLIGEGKIKEPEPGGFSVLDEKLD